MKNMICSLALANLVTPAAFAAPNTCLSQASDSDLLQEVSHRMGHGGSTPVSSYDVMASCNFSTLTLKVTSLDSGAINYQTFNTMDNSSCTSFADAINAKSSRMDHGGMVALCNFSNLTSIVVTSDGQIKTSTSNTTDNAACLHQAATINNK